MTWGRWLQKQLSDIFGEIFSFPIIFAWSGLINHRQCAKYNLMKDDIPWELINDQQFIPVLDHNKEVKGRWWYTRPSYLLKRHCYHQIFLEGHCFHYHIFLGCRNFSCIVWFLLLCKFCTLLASFWARHLVNFWDPHIPDIASAWLGWEECLLP